MKQAFPFLALLSFAPACVSTDDGGGGGGGGGGSDAPTGGAVEYQPFTARTRSLGHADSSWFQLSTTDTIGPIACGVAQDHHAGLGTAGHQILANLGFISGTPCPTGTHAMRSSCEPMLDPFSAAVDEGCAYYRRFNAQGQLLGTVAATAGAISVSGDDVACTFNVNLSFRGEAYTDAFRLTNGIVADPWCKQ